MLLVIIASTIVTAYKPLSYKEIENRFKDLSMSCPFLSISTAQAEYGIAYPEDCEGCSHMIVSIGNKLSKSVPQVYFSGCLHGDERVGPVVVTELASYLCNQYSKSSWIKHIVDNHLIIITPTTNAQGFSNFRREEKYKNSYIDPNRDFPFDNQNKCGESLTSQVIINLFQNYLFRTGITFHGGEESLTYPWGAFLHYKNSKSTEAPDLETFKVVSKAIHDFSKSKVKVGTMNDVVYPVHGGLEDWAYGGGWDKQGQSICGVKNFNNSEGLKQAFFLLETSDNKNPPISDYGQESEISSEVGGLIPQYIRMSLALIDLTQPYIEFKVRHIVSGIEISWEVWGAVSVNKTQIYYSENNSTDWLDWNKTVLKTGGGRWGARTVFIENFSKSDLFFRITAEADNWTKQIQPDPNVKPQTHMARTRTENYRVEHNGYEIIGNPLIQTEIISTKSMPNLHLTANFKGKKLEILDFVEYLEIKSELDPEIMELYEYGDYIEDNSKNNLMMVLCGLNTEVRKGVYKDCKGPNMLAGKFVQGTVSGISIFEADPPVILQDSAICNTKSVNLTFEKFSENNVLVTAVGEFENIKLKISGYSLELKSSEKERGKFLTVRNSKIIGGKLDISINGKNNEICHISVSRQIKKQYSYTKIKLPVVVIVLLVILKVTFVSWILYTRFIKRKKELTVPKYEEIELVFQNT